MKRDHEIDEIRFESMAQEIFVPFIARMQISFDFIKFISLLTFIYVIPNYTFYKNTTNKSLANKVFCFFL